MNYKNKHPAEFQASVTFPYKLQERCGGLLVSVPATGSARPGFESRPGRDLPTEWSEGRQIAL